MEVKKDKFNVDDEEFKEYGVILNNGSQNNQNNGSIKLNPYYKKVCALLKNDHEEYDTHKQNESSGKKGKQLGSMYVKDLTKDVELKAILTHFINNIHSP